MPSRTEQTQAHCYRCEQPTLHTRNIREFNHLLHGLATFFTCGTWGVIWLIAWVGHAEKKPESWRCSRCGQLGGNKTPERYAVENAAFAKAIVPKAPVIKPPPRR